MQLSETIKLFPDKQQKALILSTMKDYIAVVNRLVSDAVSGSPIAKLTTASVASPLPSALTNQCIKDANSIVRKHYSKCHKAVLQNRRLVKTGSEKRVRASRLPVLKQPCCYINNQNFRLFDDCISFPVMINGKCTRILVRIQMSERQKALLSSAKLGTMRIVIKNRRLVAQIVYEAAEQLLKTEGCVMGVDLGIKCPAVSKCSDGSVRFYGNGRRNKYMRRQYACQRKKLQKSGQYRALKRLGCKEQRVMRDIDHKISHDIVQNAVAHNVKVIKLEQLQNIRSATSQSRKNNHSLHTWSFYRLARFIEYKANLAGITVEYVNPSHTSQKCPVCGRLHHAKDRQYACECGFHTHRDILGATNICNSTEYVGNRHTA